jgi:hypothetical protein
MAVPALLLAGTCFAASQTSSSPSAPLTSDYVFPAGTGLLLFYVRADHTADFEAVAARIAQALAVSTDPARKQQAAGWRMFRSTEATREAVVYVFLLDPVVPGADYDPVRVLSESLPAEVQPLFERLKASVIRVERMALVPLP